VGKLAERLSDPARSGVYRVLISGAVEEAAALNGYLLLRVELASPAVVATIETALDAGRDQVILVDGFEGLLRQQPGIAATVLARLTDAVRHAARDGLRVFVAFVDPHGALASLPPLYRWKTKGGEP
jgi:hypothetical protein